MTRPSRRLTTHVELAGRADIPVFSSSRRPLLRAPRPVPEIHGGTRIDGDNGSTLKATNVLAMLNWLGVKPSYSRPRVSDDKDYASYCTSFERSRTGA